MKPDKIGKLLNSNARSFRPPHYFPRLLKCHGVRHIMLVIVLLTRASYAFSEFFSSFHVCSCALVVTLQSEKDRVGVARLLKWLLGTRFLQSYDIALCPFRRSYFASEMVGPSCYCHPTLRHLPAPVPDSLSRKRQTSCSGKVRCFDRTPAIRHLRYN